MVKHNQMFNRGVSTSWITIAVCILGTLLLLRFITLGHLPYLDPSESRYALVGKIMSEDGELFTPKIYKDGALIPFLSKPPLHFWLEAASIEVFGMNLVAARLPSFISALIMLGLTCYAALKLFNLEHAIISGLLLFTSGLFFYMAGSTLVDMTLSAVITGAMVSLLFFLKEGRKIWGYLFFIFLALGVLTKGPIAIIFPGISIVMWCCLTKEWWKVFKLPWIHGGLLFLALTAPVFLLMEHSNPGFLKYFFINENLLRYFIKDYGDRFGTGHRYPYGSSWLFMLVAFFPWTLLFIPLLLQKIRNGLINNDLLLYLICWGVAPALTLTFAKQLLGTYLMPSLGGLVLFTVAACPKRFYLRKFVKSNNLLLFLTIILALAVSALTIWSFYLGMTSEHIVISLCVVMLLFAAGFWLIKQKYSFQVLSILCLALSIVYTSGILSSCIYTSRFMSTEALMSSVNLQFSSHPTLYFPFGVPLSAYLYQDENEALVDGANEKTLSNLDNNTLVVVRDRQVEELKFRYGGNFNELASVGKWKVFHKEQHKDSCRQAMERSHKRCNLHNHYKI